MKQEHALLTTRENEKYTKILISRIFVYFSNDTSTCSTLILRQFHIHYDIMRKVILINYPAVCFDIQFRLVISRIRLTNRLCFTRWICVLFKINKCISYRILLISLRINRQNYSSQFKSSTNRKLKSISTSTDCTASFLLFFIFPPLFTVSFFIWNYHSTKCNALISFFVSIATFSPS